MRDSLPPYLLYGSLLSLGALVGLASVTTFPVARSSVDMAPAAESDANLFPTEGGRTRLHSLVPSHQASHRAFDAGEFNRILAEPTVYAQLKSLLTYLDHLRPEDYPRVLAQLQADDSNNREFALDVVLGRWMEVDPEGVMQAVDNAHHFEKPELAQRIISGIYGAWAARDPATALADARESLMGDDRRIALRAVLGQIARTDPTQALTLVMGMEKSQRPGSLKSIFEPWAERDAHGATQAMLGLTDPELRGQATRGILEQLIRTDPRAAQTWVDHLPVSMRDSARESLAEAWSVTDPVAAIKWIASQPAAEWKESALANAGMDWAHLDPVWAMDFARSLPPGNQKNGMIYRAVAQWTYNDAKAAWAWAKSQPLDQQKTAISTVITFWSNYDTAAAAEAVFSLSEGKDRLDSLDIIVRDWDWGRADPHASNVLLDRLPVSPARDFALAKVSDQLLKTDPEKAVQLASTASGTEAREKQLGSLFAHWLKNDPAQAKAALSRSALPAAVKEQLLRETGGKTMKPFP